MALLGAALYACNNVLEQYLVTLTETPGSEDIQKLTLGI